MQRSKINPTWPNALRWFLVQELNSFTPWHFITEPDELAGVAQTFHREDVHDGHVFVFARRQDCDDFAGLEVVDGQVTNRVIQFHPTFSRSMPSPKEWHITVRTFEDVFDFVSSRVIPDMKDWAVEEDADDLGSPPNKSFERTLEG
jgi:hypothetical protein